MNNPKGGGFSSYLGAKLRAPARIEILKKIAENGCQIALRNLSMPDLDPDDFLTAIKGLESLGYLTLSGPQLIATLTEVGKKHLKELGLMPSASLQESARPPSPLGDSTPDQIGDEVEARLRKVLGGPILANYQGSILVQALSDGNPMPLEEPRLFRVPPGTLKLAVSLAPSEGRIVSSMIAESISIKDGEERSQIPFRLELESDTLTFTPHIAALDVKEGERSRTIEFTTLVSGDVMKHLVWVQVFQQNRLVQTVEVNLSSEPTNAANA